MSLHLFTVSNSRKVSPTENNVDRQFANSFRVGGPGEPWICVVNCSTNFFWHAFISVYWLKLIVENFLLIFHVFNDEENSNKNSRVCVPSERQLELYPNIEAIQIQKPVSSGREFVWMLPRSAINCVTFPFLSMNFVNRSFS